jgi:uncharacterized membrane protein (DUF441 family)
VLDYKLIYFNKSIYIYIYIYIYKCIAGVNVSALESHSIGYSKQKNCVCTCVLFRTVTEIELFHCTVAKLLIKRYYLLFLISVFIVQVTKLLYCKFHGQLHLE